jgi:hypothetical protein
MAIFLQMAYCKFLWSILAFSLNWNKLLFICFGVITSIVNNLVFLQKLNSRKGWIVLHMLYDWLGCFLLLILILDLLSNMHDMLQIKILLKCPRKRTCSVKKMIILRVIKFQDIQCQTFLRYGMNIGYGKLISKLKHHYAFSNLSNWWTYASYIKVYERDPVFNSSKLWHWGLKSSFLNTDGNHNKSVYLNIQLSEACAPLHLWFTFPWGKDGNT